MRLPARISIAALLVGCIGATGAGCDAPEGVRACDPATEEMEGEALDDTTLPTAAPLPLDTSSCKIRGATYDVEIVDPIAYGDAHDRQRMTAYLPVGLDDAPAMIFIHGGGWWYGSRGDFHERGQYFAARGIASFSIEYMLATEDTPSFPTNVQDVVCASRFIKENAETYGIDPKAMAAYGASAGGHLAAMLGVLDGSEPIVQGACGDPNLTPKVRAVMSYFGYVDLEAAAEINPDDARVMMLLGSSWDDDPDLWRSASPGSYVDPGDAIFVTGQGLDDTVVRPVISEVFHQRLSASGIPNVLLPIEDALHGFYVHPDLDRPVRCGFEPLVDLLLGAHDAKL